MTRLYLLAGLVMSGLAFPAAAQTTFNLPVEASNCAIYYALTNDRTKRCYEGASVGLSRGIVLKLDEELERQESEDLNELIRRPVIATPTPVAKKEPVKTAAVKPAAAKPTPESHKAAKPQGGYFVQFALNSFDLEPEFENHLNRLAKVLAAPALSNTCIRVTGHTDTTGSAEYNKKLSQNRAVIVASHLAEKGNISPDRILIAAAGESKPLPDINGSDPLNRRVEFSTKETTNGCAT